MNDAGNNPPPDENVTFLQHALPGLRVGPYELTVAHRVTEVSGDGISRTYRFAIRGDRFRLSRPDMIQSVFPADHATGRFDTVLPHLVMRKPTFPWSRSPMTAAQALGPVDADVPTWLAILVLDHDDAAAHPGTSIAARSGTIAELFAPAGMISYFGPRQDQTQLDPGDTLDQPIRVVELPLALFWQVAPTADDLKLLAHVRRVAFANRATMPGVSDVGEPEGDFAVLFGNRLPADGRVTTAHLVSLEGLAGLLPTGPDGTPPPAHAGDAAKPIRLAVLWSWSFTSMGGPATFTHALKRLNASGQSTLRLPDAVANPQIDDALAMGFVPLSHRLRDGGRTVSWYRGPLAPYAVEGGRLGVRVGSADEALIFDPTTGMLDASYSAAWTLGRMLALQDKAFSTALYGWRQGLLQQVADTVETEVLASWFGDRMREAAASGSAPTARHLMHGALMSLARLRRE
jgi:hypothetical protein